MAVLPPRELDDGCTDTAPKELQELSHSAAVLSIAVSDEYIFAATSNGEISVWSLGSYQLVQTIQAHRHSVLCLFLTSDYKHLFSSACEPIISIWCPKTFVRLFEIYSTYDVGDVFSVVYSAQRDTVYIGTQTASIQWVSLKDAEREGSAESASHPDKRQHRFFDSRAVGGTSTPRRTEDHYALIPRAQALLEIDSGAIEQYAHFGWVFCLRIARGPSVLVDADEDVLVSGGGDGTIKIWRLTDDGTDYGDGDKVNGGIVKLLTLGEDDGQSVLCLEVDGSFLYAGKLDGIVELWDIDTQQKLRVIKAHDDKINSLKMSFGLLWSASASGSASVSRLWENGHTPWLTKHSRTALSTTPRTPLAARQKSAKNTSASPGGRPMAAGSSRRRLPFTARTSCSSLAPTTTRFGSGVLTAYRPSPSRRWTSWRT